MSLFSLKTFCKTMLLIAAAHLLAGAVFELVVNPSPTECLKKHDLSVCKCRSNQCGCWYFPRKCS